MWFEPIFFTGSLAVFNKECGESGSRRASRLTERFTFAAEGGEMRPNYFQYTQPARKSQIFGSRLASLGDQIVRNFGRKNQLAVLF